MISAACLVVGEALVDVIHRPDRPAVRVPGGSSFTVARGVALLAPGTDVSFLTDLGDDADGGLLSDHLRRAGVAVLARPRGGSSLAHARLDADGSAEYDFDLRWEPALDLVPDREWQVLHVGSIGAFLSPGCDVVDVLLRGMRDAATIRTFDPNIRPSLLENRAAVRARFESVVQDCDVVKLSDADAAWLYPQDGLDRVLDRVLSAGPGLAVLTRGAAGSTLRTPRIRVDVAAAPVSVIADTIGAGDSFMATLIAELLTRGATRTDVADLDLDAVTAIGRRAARVAGVVVGREGADIPSADEVV